MGQKGDKLKTYKLQYPCEEVLPTLMAQNGEKPCMMYKEKLKKAKNETNMVI